MTGLGSGLRSSGGGEGVRAAAGGREVSSVARPSCGELRGFSQAVASLLGGEGLGKLQFGFSPAAAGREAAAGPRGLPPRRCLWTKRGIGACGARRDSGGRGPRRWREDQDNLGELAL